MEREQLRPSQIIKRLADMPATEVELAETCLGIARQNREDLAKFRDLAREAANLVSYANPHVEDLAQRLAARHKEE